VVAEKAMAPLTGDLPGRIQAGGDLVVGKAGGRKEHDLGSARRTRLANARMSARFERILTQGLIDVGRPLDPANDQLFTWGAPWRNMRQCTIGWRIDYILASASLIDRVTACRVRADVGTSDQAPIVADISQ
jgi:exonuclease III